MHEDEGEEPRQKAKVKSGFDLTTETRRRRRGNGEFSEWKLLFFNHKERKGLYKGHKVVSAPAMCVLINTETRRRLRGNGVVSDGVGRGLVFDEMTGR